MMQRQEKDQKLGSNDREDERKIHPKGLSNHSVHVNAKPETEADDSQGI
jgi:hypothetical protein